MNKGIHLLCKNLPEFRKAWLGLNHSKEQYVLRYESDYMKEMGEAIEKMTASVAKATGRKMIQGAIINGNYLPLYCSIMTMNSLRIIYFIASNLIIILRFR